MKHLYIISLVLLGASLQSMQQTIDNRPEWQQAHDSLKFVLKDHLKTYIEKAEKDKIDIKKLSTQYQWAIGSSSITNKILSEYENEDGDTLTHILVTHSNPTALYDCAKMDIIPIKPNKAGFSPFDIALKNFSQVIHDDASLNQVTPKSCNIRCKEKCCFYILYNYMKTQERNKLKEKNKKIYKTYMLCCDSHT